MRAGTAPVTPTRASSGEAHVLLREARGSRSSWSSRSVSAGSKKREVIAVVPVSREAGRGRARSRAGARRGSPAQLGVVLGPRCARAAGDAADRRSREAVRVALDDCVCVITGTSKSCALRSAGLDRLGVLGHEPDQRGLVAGLLEARQVDDDSDRRRDPREHDRPAQPDESARRARGRTRSAHRRPELLRDQPPEQEVERDERHGGYECDRRGRGRPRACVAASCASARRSGARPRPSLRTRHREALDVVGRRSRAALRVARHERQVADQAERLCGLAQPAGRALEAGARLLEPVACAATTAAPPSSSCFTAE